MREGVRGLRNWQTFQEVVVVVDVVIVLMQSDISLLKIMIQLLSLSILFIAIARGHSSRRRIHFLHKPLSSAKNSSVCLLKIRYTLLRNNKEVRRSCRKCGIFSNSTLILQINHLYSPLSIKLYEGLGLGCTCHHHTLCTFQMKLCNGYHASDMKYPDAMISRIHHES
jgi:hypothetical protein